MKTLEELKKEFEERIDFLSEHWIKGDDKPPFSFGGWRGEVVDELVSITEKAIKRARGEVLEEVEKIIAESEKKHLQGGFCDDGSVVKKMQTELNKLGKLALKEEL